MTILLARLIALLAAPVEADHKARWQRDPLAHPALETMSERELADLPIGPAWPEPAQTKSGAPVGAPLCVTC